MGLFSLGPLVWASGPRWDFLAGADCQPSLSSKDRLLTDSLAVKASGVLESFLNTLGARRSSVPLLILVPSTSA
jgi:hypothetical protein